MSPVFVFGFLIFIAPFLPLLSPTVSFGYVQTGWVFVFFTAPVGFALMLLGFILSSKNGRAIISCLLLLSVFVYYFSELFTENGGALLPVLLSGLALTGDVIYTYRTYQARADEEEAAYWKRRCRKNWQPLSPSNVDATEGDSTITTTVTPAQAGVHAMGLQQPQLSLESGLRRNDVGPLEKNNVR